MSTRGGGGTPTGSLDLLARAALAPEAEAVTAWQAWRLARDIETTPWNEVRMLGAVAARIDQLEPGSPIRARMLGIRKFLWVQSQICINDSLAGITALIDAQIPVLLFKGAARIALDPGAAQERLIRDMDVLVPVGQELAAFKTLEAAGWQLVDEPWQVNLRRVDPISAHHAWSLRKGRAEIDLHHCSNHLNRLAGDDVGLWERSGSIVWRNLHVQIPSPTDALIIALVHGLRWSVENAADWTVDACSLLDQQAIDWTRLVAETERRCLQAIVSKGLAYLQHALGRQVPQSVMQTLQASTDDTQKTELRNYETGPDRLSLADAAAAASLAVRRAMGKVQTQPPVLMSPRALARQGVALGQINELYWVKRPAVAFIEDWVIVQVDLVLARPGLDRQVAGEFRLPGLHLGVARAHVPDPKNHPCLVRFHCPIYRPMLDGWRARQIGFTCLSQHAVQPPGVPIRAEIAWFSSPGR